MRLWTSLYIALFFLALLPTDALASWGAQAWPNDAKKQWDALVEENTASFKDGDFDRSMALAQKALDLAEKTVGPDHPDTANSLNDVGMLYSLKKDYDKAEPALVQALTIFDNAADLDGARIVLANLAEMYEDMRNFDKAGAMLTLFVDVTKRLYGDDHPAVGQAMTKLSNFYMLQHDFEKAQAAAEEALAVADAQEHNPQNVVISLNNLGRIQLAQRDYATAEKTLIQAITLGEETLGPEHNAVAEALNNLAGVYSEQKNFAKAIPLFAYALDLRERGLPPNHPAVAESLRNLGMAYKLTGDMENAAPLLKRAHALSRARGL